MIRNGMAPNRYDRTRNGIEERRQDPKWNSMMSCILFKYARKLYEAGFVYAEEDVLSAYNDGYACGMEQGIEAERSRQG